MSTDFEKHQAALLQQLGTDGLAAAQKADPELMKRATGIQDPDLVGDLLELGVRPESLTLMSVAPLVAVAWADGAVQPGERAEILRVAEAKGIVEGSHAHVLLEQWLDAPPGERLLETWEAFVKDIIAKWPEDKAARFQEQVHGLTRSVAEASGGVLGLATISGAEEAILARVKNAFSLSWR